MANRVAHRKEREVAGAIIQHLHRLVTYGPWDLDVAAAMSAYGYDEVKWAEGQGVLAELVTCDLPVDRCLTAAIEWYNEAATAARDALDAKPQLLAKIGVVETGMT